MLERKAAPLREQAVEVLRGSIVSGEMAPGSRITEKAIEQRLDVLQEIIGLHEADDSGLGSLPPPGGAAGLCDRRGDHRARRDFRSP